MRIKIRDKNLTVRKWKVSDKNKFVNGDKDALVYDCIESSDVVLSNEEYQYALINIRELSLSKTPVSYIFNCSSCKKDFDFDANLKEIFKLKFEPYGTLKSFSDTIEVGDILNKEFYYKNVINGNEIADFIMHIKTINGNDCMSFEDMLEFINTMDVDSFECIWADWKKMKSTVTSTSNVQCPKCNSIELYEFDDLPGFFPTSWNVA